MFHSTPGFELRRTYQAKVSNIHVASTPAGHFSATIHEHHSASPVINPNQSHDHRLDAFPHSNFNDMSPNLFLSQDHTDDDEMDADKTITAHEEKERKRIAKAMKMMQSHFKNEKFSGDREEDWQEPGDQLKHIADKYKLTRK